MRKWLAGRLIRLAHRIYTPNVTEYVIAAHDVLAHMRAQQDRSQVYPGLR